MNLTKTAGKSETSDRLNIQLLRIMRLTAILFLAGCLQVAASTRAQKITWQAKDASIFEAFQVIKEQTGFSVAVEKQVLTESLPVSIIAEDMPLQDFLTSLLATQPLTFVISEQTIFLKKKISPVFATERKLQNPITGVVKDTSGNFLAGASVTVKRSKKSVQTNTKGEFTIQAQIGDELIISYIGFESRVVKISDENIIIVLSAASSPLDEIQIKAYGTTTKRFNTGNISTINAEIIQQQPVSDPLLTLQGRVPGLNISQTSGVQGAAVKVQIRGKASINNGTQPLFIVDGVPYEQNLVAPPFGGFGAIGSEISALNFINPADIASIDVLKDAEATAIYGSRGANGVILITTRKGSPGKTSVNVSASTGWQKLLRTRTLLNTRQYLDMRHEAFSNDNEEPNEFNAPDLTRWDTTRFTDWQKEMLGKTATYTDAQASVTGGNNNLTYLVGGNYHREGTIYPGDFNTARGGLHFNLGGSAINQKLLISLTTNYNFSSNDFPGGDFARRIYTAPNAPKAYNDDGSLNWENSTWDNPFAQIVSNRVDQQTNNLLSNLDVSYKFSSALAFKINLGFNDLQSNAFRAKLLAGSNPANVFETAEGNYSTSRIKTWIAEPQLQFSDRLGEGRLTILLGSTLTSIHSQGQYVFTGGIPDDALVENPLSATIYFVSSDGFKYRYGAVFGQLGYQWQDKYLFNASFRRDGSSRFGPENKFSSFGSAAAAWILSEEAWVKSLRFVQFAKLRASFGITGNDQIGNYQYLDRYEFQSGVYQGYKGLRVVNSFNPNYAWERTQKMEVGLETRWINDRLALDISRYQFKSDKQLGVIPTSIITGFIDVLGNLPAVIRNTGWEIALTADNVKGANFSWTTNVTFSANKNKLLSYEGPNELLRPGHPVTEVSLYQFLEVDPQTGRFLALNAEGEPVIIDAGDSKRAQADPAPVFYGGIGNNLRWRSLSLSFFLQYARQTGLAGMYPDELAPGALLNQPIEVLDRWRKPGDNASMQRFSQNGSLFNEYGLWFIRSSASYTDASFIRCKNIVVAWQLPGRWKSRMNARSAELFVNAQNVFTITGYKGWDPETQNAMVTPPLFSATVGFRLSL